MLSLLKFSILSRAFIFVIVASSGLSQVVIRDNFDYNVFDPNPDQNNWGGPIDYSNNNNYFEYSVGNRNVLLARNRSWNTGGSESIYLPWVNKTGSAKQNWSVQVDVNLGSGVVSPRGFAAMGIFISPNDNSDNYITIDLSKDVFSNDELGYYFNIFLNDDYDYFKATSSETIYLDYFESNKTIQIGLVQAGNKIVLNNHSISSWNLANDTEFELALFFRTYYPTDATGSGVFIPIISEFYFDNFIVNLEEATISIPDDFTLFSPANNASFTSQQPVFLNWNSSQNATSYKVFLEKDDSTPDNLVTTISSTSWDASQSLSPGTWYWTVVAQNSAGETPSATRSFVVTSPEPQLPGSFAVIAPANNTSFTNQQPVILNWNSSQNATSYKVFLEKDDSTPDNLVTTISSTSWDASQSLSPGTWYWTVVAQNSAGETPSATRSFAVTSPESQLPGSFALIYPPNNAEISTQLNELVLVFDWNDSVNAVEYDIYIDKNNANPTRLYRTTTESKQNVSYNEVNVEAGDWFWKVVAKNQNGETSSNVHKLTLVKQSSDFTLVIEMSTNNGLSWSMIPLSSNLLNTDGSIRIEGIQGEGTVLYRLKILSE